jgi:hypothetical protein
VRTYRTYDEYTRLLTPIFTKEDTHFHAKCLYCPVCGEELTGELNPTNVIVGRLLFECTSCDWYVTGDMAEELYFLFI